MDVNDNTSSQMKLSGYQAPAFDQQPPSKPGGEKTNVLCKEINMSEHHVMVKQQIYSEIPPKSMEQPTKSDAVTAALVSIFEARVIDVLPALGFLFLTYNVVDDLLKAEGDYKTISFVVFSYANLIALFCGLKSFERLPEGESPKKRRLKIAVRTCTTSLCLSFCTLLNFSFSYRVTSILDSVVMSSFVWTLAVAFTVGVFYELFLVS